MCPAPLNWYFENFRSYDHMKKCRNLLNFNFYGKKLILTLLNNNNFVDLICQLWLRLTLKPFQHLTIQENVSSVEGNKTKWSISLEIRK